MNKYECLYIVNPSLEDEPRKAVIERFTGLVAANNGTVDDVDEWGKRRLAYPIQDLNEGYYVLMHFSAPAELPKELERNFRNHDSIMRYLVIRQGE